MKPNQCDHKGQNFSVDCQSTESGTFICRVHCADCGGHLDDYPTREPQLIMNAFRRGGEL